MTRPAEHPPVGHRTTALDVGPMGQLVSVLFVISGVATLSSLLLPASESLQRTGVVAVGFAALALGAIFWFLPWHEWSPSTAMWRIVPIAEALIALHNYYGGNDPYRYGLFFMVVYVWVGASQARWTTAWLAPVTLLAYELPLILDHRPASAMWSALYAVPIFTLVGEAIAWLASELRRTTASLELQALHDPLTGLANRLLLDERIESARRRSERNDTHLGVVFLDVDHFKAINDTLGHDQGDAVLREVGKRLVDAVRATDTVARNGGDEFVVLIEDEDKRVPHVIAARIEAAFADPFALECGATPVSVSIGVAVGSARDGIDLLSRSDEAMYAAKRQGRPLRRDRARAGREPTCGLSTPSDTQPEESQMISRAPRARSSRGSSSTGPSGR